MIARLLIAPPLAVAVTWYLLGWLGFPIPLETSFTAALIILLASVGFSITSHPRPASIFGVIMGVIVLPIRLWIAAPVMEKMGYDATIAAIAAFAISAFIALLAVQPWVRYRAPEKVRGGADPKYTRPLD